MLPLFIVRKVETIAQGLIGASVVGPSFTFYQPFPLLSTQKVLTFSGSFWSTRAESWGAVAILCHTTWFSVLYNEGLFLFLL